LGCAPSVDHEDARIIRLGPPGVRAAVSRAWCPFVLRLGHAFGISLYVNRAFPIFVVFLLAVGSGWPIFDAELTAPAARLFGADAAADLISDGVAVWSDWMPLGGAWGLESLQGERLLQWGFWLALMGALYGLAIALGLTPWAGTLLVACAAAHPISAALYGDLAGRGLLVACTFMVWTTAMAWCRDPARRHSPLELAAVFMASLLACLAHPFALILPIVLVLSSWMTLPHLRGARIHYRPLAAATLPALLVLTARWFQGVPFGVDLSNHGAVTGDEVAPSAGLALVGRALEALHPGLLPIRRPCEVDVASIGLDDPSVWFGALALLAMPMVARRLASPALSLGLWWLWAVLVACSQLAEPLPSELAPGIVALGWCGGALIIAGLMDREKVRVGGLALALAVGALMVPSARHVFTGEQVALETRVESCGDAVDPRVQLARHLATQGDGKSALTLLDGLEGEEVTATRFEIHLARHSWGPLRRELRGLKGDAALMWKCRAGAVMSEINAVPSCAKAREVLGDLPDLVAAHVTALARDRRVKEAERLARDQLKAHPDEAVLYDALVSILEKAGWMRETVEVLEEWYAGPAGSGHVKLRLGAALMNKGKGDLVQGRAEEAKTTFLRGLDLQPKRHELRYLLARAHRDLGDLKAAARERKRAQDAGAKEPMDPLQMRDMPRIPEL
jgi:hypothetical protein